MFPPDVIQAHKHSSNHKEEVQKSEVCGCFYCLAIFKPEAIEIWIDERESDGVGQTAICPLCGIDSVIGSRSGFPITETFLMRMYKHWFK